MKAKMEHYLLFTNSGMTYQYGNSPTSKIAYKNKSGFSRIASWYVNKVTDKYSNYITYEYEVSNLCIRPIEITYGTNALKNRGVTNLSSLRKKMNIGIRNGNG